MFKCLCCAMLIFSTMLINPSMVLAQSNHDAAKNMIAPVTIIPENTVIYSPMRGESWVLQFLLLHGVANAADANTYSPLADRKDLDRTAPKAFPLYEKIDDIPKGKTVIALVPFNGAKDEYTSLIPEDVMAQLKATRASVAVIPMGDKIIIAADAQKANGVSGYFANHFAGVRMYAPSDDNLWTSVNPDGQFTAKAMKVYNPPFYKVTFAHGAFKRNNLWYRVTQPLAQQTELRAGHDIIKYFDPNTHYEKYPQLYPMGSDGKRAKPSGAAWNPCLRDPVLAADVAMLHMRELMSKRNHFYLSLGIMDDTYNCKCDVCQQSLKASGDNDAGSLYYSFLNEVCKRAAKEFPGLWITGYYYSNVSVPAGMKLEPNMAVDYVCKSYRWATHPSSMEMDKQQLQAIHNAGASWVLHDWFFSGVSPRIYSNTWATFLQWGAANGMKGIYTEWSPGQYWYLDGANYWVQRELLTDPYQNADGLWRTYCRDMFGPAAETMHSFYNIMAQKQLYIDDHVNGSADSAKYDFAAYFPHEIAALRKLLQDAIATTEDDEKIQKRLAAVQRYFVNFEQLNAAAGEPYRLNHRAIQQGQGSKLNKEALAYYLNDDPSKMSDALNYFDHKLTIAPDEYYIGPILGEPQTLRNAYAAALGTILQVSQAMALENVDTSKPSPALINKLQKATDQVLDDNLPKKYDPKRLAQIKAIAGRFLFIPKVELKSEKDQIVIDGDLSDAAWKNGTVLDGFTKADVIIPSPDGNTAKGYILRVGDQLLIGLTMQQPNGVWALTTPDVHTGTRIWRESCVQIFMGPHGDTSKKAPNIQYIVNALGAFRGFNLASDNRENVTAAGKIAEDKKSYTIEISLPLKVEGKYDLTKDKTLTFNIMREAHYKQSYGTDERSGWYPIFFSSQWPESRGVTFMQGN